MHMSVTVDIENTGNPGLRNELLAVIEHIFAEHAGQWRVAVVGSQANDRWEMKITGPNAFDARTRSKVRRESTGQR